MPPDAGYEIGYKKPPKHSQFRKGQTGNPRGRPAGSKNLATLLNEALDETVEVTDNGRRRKISKRVAIVIQLVNRSVQADAKATATLLAMIQEFERRSEGSKVPAALSEADRQVLRFLLKRQHSDQLGDVNV